MHDHFKVKMNSEPIKIKELFDVGMRLAEIFRSEHILIEKISFETFQ